MAMPTASVSIAGQGIPAYSGIHAYEVWSPLAIPSLQLWLDGRRRVYNSISPDVPATNGQTVRRWGNSANPGTYDGDQATSTFQPTYDATEKSVVFDGVDNIIPSVSPPVTLGWCVLVRAVVSSGGRLFSFRAAGMEDHNSPLSMTCYFNSATSVAVFQNSANRSNAVPFALNQKQTAILNIDGTGNGRLYVEGNSEPIGVPLTSLLPAQFSDFGYLNLGTTPTSLSTGRVLQTLVYNSFLSSTEISQLQAWAATL